MDGGKVQQQEFSTVKDIELHGLGKKEKDKSNNRNPVINWKDTVKEFVEAAIMNEYNILGIDR